MEFNEINKISEQHEYKVLCRCYTYNQASYIEDALNGFAMQQTNFPFVCLVIDDCSTDGEQEVIKSWMKENCDMEKSENVELAPSSISFVPHKNNKSCFFAIYFLKKNLFGNPLKTELVKPWLEHCQYHAFCEGDDYWIDPLKLQKQVDFLDTHPDFSICFHHIKIFKQREQKLVDDYIYREVPSESDIVELSRKCCYIPTASVVYRNDIKLRSEWSSLGKMPFGDYTLFLALAEKGKIKKLEDCMSVYREGVGVCSSNAYDKSKHFSWQLRHLSAISKIHSVLENAEAKSAMQEQIDEYFEYINSLYLRSLDYSQGIETMLQQKINTIETSFSYRVGVIVTKPLRIFYSIFKK